MSDLAESILSFAQHYHFKKWKNTNALLPPIPTPKWKEKCPSLILSQLLNYHHLMIYLFGVGTTHRYGRGLGPPGGKK